ncbi:MAG: metallophosphoesterase [Planctomycetales bacterium]|nr:metallophosphoesterase [Planctomycetales bacterium]
MRAAWLTDIHLNFVRPSGLEAFLDAVVAADPDAVLLTGDIAESHDVTRFLARLDESLQRPLYFVLGNHDFYFGSIAGVRQAVDQLCLERPNLCYLTHSSPIELTKSIGLLGHDGWADAREGDYERSYVMMNDYQWIRELSGMDKRQRLPLLHALGDEAAQSVRERLPAALDQFAHVVLLTHVPPLRGACWHEGRLSDDEWAPHFVCQAMGTAILEIMSRYPHRQLTVLCGHTHGSGVCYPADNIVIHTGPAEYGRPGIVKMWEW